jgi:Cu/Ag efflux protein CusF
MKGMDMKNMDAQKCKDMLASRDANMTSYKATAVVKEVDVANGKVMLAHEPVKSLNWPAMTMGFAVKDKTLLDKLAVGKRVNVEFRKEGTDYVVISVK